MLGCGSVAEGLDCGCMVHQQVAVGMSHFISTNDTLKTVYFAYFHSLVKYSKMFWGNSVNIKKVLSLQKGILRVKMGLGLRCSWQRTVQITKHTTGTMFIYAFLDDVRCR